MAYLQEQMDILKFDKRLLEINLKNGSLTENEYKTHLSQLNDVESQSEKLVLKDSPTAAAPAESVEQVGQVEQLGQVEQPVSPLNSHSQEEAVPSSVTPPNRDPFGSGF